MLLEILAAILVATGLMGLVLSFSSGKGDIEIAKTLLVSILFLAIGGWVIINSLGFYVLLRKALGLVILLSGGFMAFKFPGSYCQEGFFQNLVIFLGLILIVFGAYLAMF